MSVLICSAVTILIEYAPFFESEIETQVLRRNRVHKTPQPETEQTDAEHTIQPLNDSEEMDQSTFLQIDWQELLEENPDIIGWIDIPQSNISYPILQHNSDNSYYLSHSFSNTENVLGSIYIYKESNKNFTDPHTIIFGHNMRSGQMFGTLSDYLKEDVFEKNKEIYLYLPEKRLQYTIYSVYECSVYDDVYQIGDDLTEQEADLLVAHTQRRAQKSRNVEVPSGTKTITLSTCSDSGDAKRRFVVNGVLAAETDMTDQINRKD